MAIRIPLGRLVSPDGKAFMDHSSERATVTVDEAARILGIGRAAAYEGVRSGRIPAIRVSSRRIVVPKRALANLLSVPTISIDGE